MAIDKIYTGATSPVEDGLRTHGGPGTYEWWYMDSEFDDGTKTSIVYLTKQFAEVADPSHPTVWFDLAIPGQEPVRYWVFENPGTPIQADLDGCNVKINNCTFKRQENGAYVAHFETDDHNVVFDFTLSPTAPMWRPGDGYFRFDRNPEEYFAWFVAVPNGIAEGKLTIDGKTCSFKGTGYHDHNWGNAAPLAVMDHWYWCRASVGGYTVIDCDIIGSKRNDYQRRTVFMVHKEDEGILSDDSYVTITRDGTYHHEVLGKFMDNHLGFKQTVGDTQWNVEYFREKDIVCKQTLSGPAREAAVARGLDPTYVRCIGKVKLTKATPDGEETYENDALWEQMGFGAIQDAIIKEF